MIIRIKNLETSVLIGVYDHEKTVRQPLYVDIEIVYDIDMQMLLNGEDVIVDYAAVEVLVKDIVEKDHVDYLETLAHVILIVLGDQLPEMLSATIKLRKPKALKWSETVEVELTMNY